MLEVTDVIRLYCQYVRGDRCNKTIFSHVGGDRRNKTILSICWG